MFRSYKLYAAHIISRRWPWVIAFWVILALTLRWFAPPWGSIAQDGDLQFLPESLPSRIGQRWLEEGFSERRARSQLVIVAARVDSKLNAADIALPLDLGRRLTHAAGIASYQRLLGTERSGLHVVKNIVADQKESLEVVLKFFDEAIELDQQWFDVVKAQMKEDSDLLANRLAAVYWDRSQIKNMLGRYSEAQADRDAAVLISPSIINLPDLTKRADPAWAGLLDVWTWRDPILGSKLGDKHPNAKLISLQLDTEFIATKNIELLTRVEQWIDGSKKLHRPLIEEGLEVGVSGSAAVGGDMLRAAAGSVQQTEWVTIALILIILIIVYRGPLLVAIPMVTIGVSLMVASSIIAMLANDPLNPGPQSGLQVFTTTRIFLIVLLFGAGTDFCLFFIARCREAFTQTMDPSRKQVQRMIAGSWFSVHDALVGSALTTILGLGLMYFSDFEKFKFTGLIIGLGLFVTILVCLTLTPSIVCGLGKFAFWPTFSRKEIGDGAVSGKEDRWVAFWGAMADIIIARPATTLGLCVLFLGVPAIKGWWDRNLITYDFAHELSPTSPSRSGTRLIERFFNTRDSSPVTVVISSKSAAADDKELRSAIEHLRLKLYVDGVTSVRSLTDPLGDYPPEKRMGLFAQEAWRRRLLENHRIIQHLYVASNPQYAGRIARLDVLLDPSPFSTKAETILKSIQDILDSEIRDQSSPWFDASYACTGTTPGIHDLKMVTQADQFRIQILVTLGVWLVLVVMLRKWWISGYLILTVLLSYLTTLGLTLWFFSWAYGDDFIGLDWKVPLFLFVILVAVGQDYNVYLTTRVLEEQSKHGPILGLRRAMALTGGIITSCGIVMAGTFASMTSGAVANYLATLGFPVWMVGDASTPVLRGIVELGFALSLGVLIDTLVVRTILVPAMFAWLTRRGNLAGR